MAEIYNFNKDEEQCECSACELAIEYVELVKTAENDEHLFNMLRELIQESGEMELTRFLQEEVSQKVHLLNHLYGECED